MSTTLELLDAWKSAKGIPSDNQAALALGITRGAVSRWRNEGTEAEDATLVRMARDLKRNPDIALLQVATKRASTPELVDLLTRIAKKMGIAACILFSFLYAEPSSASHFSPTFDNVYIHAHDSKLILHLGETNSCSLSGCDLQMCTSLEREQQFVHTAR